MSNSIPQRTSKHHKKGSTWKSLLLLPLIFGVMIQCDSPKQVKLTYHASNGDTIAHLDLTRVENRFFGQLELTDKSTFKDSGAVQGEIRGDTLIGRFTFPLRARQNKIKPFVLLKDGLNYKLGTGSTWTYLNIPYYHHNTIRFDTSSLYFTPTECSFSNCQMLN